MSFNMGSVKLRFTDAYRKLITGKFELEFRNKTVSSLNFEKTVHLTGVEHTLVGIPAYPTGSWYVDILPDKYRLKKTQIEVPSNGEVVIEEEFFINPSKARFVLAEDVATGPRLGRLWETIPYSTPTGLCFVKLSDEQKAGLLNLYAKMSDPKAHRVFDYVTRVISVKPARILAEVREDLWGFVKGLPNDFKGEPGLMHSFEDGWRRLEEDESFKTRDPMGNLQLTFAKNDKGGWAVDADLDDNQGIKHAFDVIKHKFSGDTHPYDIHEVLTRFHDLDTGYRLG